MTSGPVEYGPCVVHVCTEQENRAGIAVSEGNMMTVMMPEDFLFQGVACEGIPFKCVGVLSRVDPAVRPSRPRRGMVTFLYSEAGFQRRYMPKLGPAPKVGDAVEIAGFRLDGGNPSTATFLKMPVAFISGRVCPTSMTERRFIGGDCFCIEAGRDDFRGFVGGPVLVRDRTGPPTLVGIVHSFASGSTIEDPQRLLVTGLPSSLRR